MSILDLGVNIRLDAHVAGRLARHGTDVLVAAGERRLAGRRDRRCAERSSPNTSRSRRASGREQAILNLLVMVDYRRLATLQCFGGFFSGGFREIRRALLVGLEALYGAGGWRGFLTWRRRTDRARNPPR